MTNFAVIGAGFGDEGKGMTTLALMTHFGIDAAMRFNGGAQAGHTTVKGGIRHVNSAFGSGTIIGATTRYTKDVIFDPISVVLEQNLSHGILEVDPDCRVATVYDVMYNRLVMRALGINNGCGKGINATITRHKVIPLYVKDCTSRQSLENIIPQIKEYYKNKLDIYGGDSEIFHMDVGGIVEQLYNQVMNSSFITLKTANMESVVFEGAQGLMLDQELGVMPFLTPSFTGLKNVAQYDVAPVYCTRTFLTRHGDGPFTPRNPFVNREFEYVDGTNVRNQYQGEFKLAPLNLDMMDNFIGRDCSRVNYDGQIYLSVSHIDIFDYTPIYVVTGGALIKINSWEEFASTLNKKYKILVEGRGVDVEKWRVNGLF